MGSPLLDGYEHRYQPVAPSTYKRGTQIRYSLSSKFYPKTLLKFPFEHSILVEAEN